MPDFNNMRELNVCLLIFSALVVLFLLIGAIADTIRIRPFMKIFIRLLIVDIIMQLGEAGMWMFAGSPEKIPLLKLCCVMSFGGGSLLIALYTYCLLEFCRESETVSMLPAHIMAVACCIMLLLVIVSVFNGMIFTYDAQGVFSDGPLAFVVNLFDIITFLVEVFLIIRYQRLYTMRGMLSLLSFCILPFFTMLLVDVWYPTPEYLATTLSLIMVFILFHRKLVKQLAEQEKELQQSRISIKLSQLQPHFLYNTISAIRELCRQDPEQAFDGLGFFATYLRFNLDSLGSEKLIPFTKELNHIQTYLELEQMRFGEELVINYDIQVKDFYLPPLCVQPLVENAVKHGLCKKEGKGVLLLRTREQEDKILIEIQDDGVGFDVEKWNSKKEQTKHYGIENVSMLLKQMINAELMIDSEPQKGTTVRILIDKKKKVGE